MISYSATYGTLYNSALSYIKSICDNYTRYGSISNAFKRGYSNNFYSNQSGYVYRHSVMEHGKNWGIRFYAVINSGSVVERVSASTIEREFKNYMTSLGIYSKLSNTITTNGLYDFMSAVANFCYTKIWVVSSHFDSNRWMVYRSNQTKFNSLSCSLPTDEKIYRNPVANLESIWNKSICKNIRVMGIKYDITYSDY